MSAAGVGPPSDDYRAACRFTGPTSHGPPCGAPAVVHVRVLAADWGDVALEACDDHAEIARRAGRRVGEHQHAGFCGLPGTVWTDDECVIDDSGVEPELVGAAEATQ